jgi:PTS system mannose-specific IIA component
VEVVTGVNLPMLLKLSEMREGISLKDYAVNIRDYGMKNIYLASETLNKKVAV